MGDNTRVPPPPYAACGIKKDEFMDDLYNRFRFTRKDIFRGRSENIVQFVFFQVSFFLDLFEDGYFFHKDLSKSVNLAAECSGLIIPDQELLVHQVMDFFCEELGYHCIQPDYYSDIREMITVIIIEELPGGHKFIEPLSRMITEEFKTGNYTTTLAQVVSRLKSNPSLRFLPTALLDLAVRSVYDFFNEPDEEDE